MCSKHIALVVSLAAALASTAGTAGAHGMAGKRFFPATLAIDDPFVADELSLPTVQHIKRPADGDRPATRETEVSAGAVRRVFVATRYGPRCTTKLGIASAIGAEAVSPMVTAASCT